MAGAAWAATVLLASVVLGGCAESSVSESLVYTVSVRSDDAFDVTLPLPQWHACFGPEAWTEAARKSHPRLALERQAGAEVLRLWGNATDFEMHQLAPDMAQRTPCPDGHWSVGNSTWDTALVTVHSGHPWVSGGALWRPPRERGGSNCDMQEVGFSGRELAPGEHWLKSGSNAVCIDF